MTMRKGRETAGRERSTAQPPSYGGHGAGLELCQIQSLIDDTSTFRACSETSRSTSINSREMEEPAFSISSMMGRMSSTVASLRRNGLKDGAAGRILETGWPVLQIIRRMDVHRRHGIKRYPRRRETPAPNGSGCFGHQSMEILRAGASTNSAMSPGS